MDHYKHSSVIIAAVLSLTVHATAVVYLGHYESPSAGRPQSADSVMRISLAPARPVEPQPEPKPAPPPRPEPQPEPEPPPEPPPPVKKPVPEIKPVRKPLPKPVIKPVPTSIEEPETKEPVEEQIASTSYTKAPLEKPALDQVVLENVRESYLVRMLAHIDRHKYYPRKARRRGIEGEVNIAFYLHKDGSITDLQVSGGSKVLRKAAKQAVQEALSLPRPPESIPLQEQIRFGMVYRLDR